MRIIKQLKVLATVLMATLSLPALAHSANHNDGLMEWFSHQLTSADHLAALLMLALLMAAAAALLGRLRRRLVKKPATTAKLAEH